MFSVRPHSQRKRWHQTSSCGQKETNNLFGLKAQCCRETWSSEQLHRNYRDMGWRLTTQLTSVTAEPMAQQGAGELRDTERDESKAWSERQSCHFWQGRSWPKWSAFLNANWDFCVLNAIARVDANNLGVNFLLEVWLLCWEGTSWWRKLWVSNMCYYTCLWPENLSLMAPSLQCLYLLSNAALCAEAGSFFFLQLYAILAPSQEGDLPQVSPMSPVQIKLTNLNIIWTIFWRILIIE